MMSQFSGQTVFLERLWHAILPPCEDVGSTHQSASGADTNIFPKFVSSVTRNPRAA